MAGPDLLESTRPPDERVARDVAPPRSPVGLRVLLWALGAVAVAVVVAQVVAGGTPTAGRSQAPTPLDRRGPSHPLVRVAPVLDGWQVVGRVDGFGMQAQTATVRWPAGAQVALLARCPSGPTQVWINFAGREPVRATSCTPAGTLVSTADMPALLVPGGAAVTVRAANETVGSGAWVVAVLSREPSSPWAGAS